MDKSVHDSDSLADAGSPGKRIDFSDRLLAETVRSAEAVAGISPAADEAAGIGQSAGGDLENRIVRRAAALSIAGNLKDALHQVGTATVLVILAGVVLSLVAGAAAASAALGAAGGEPVNVFWVLGSLLGVQTLLLLAWIAVMFIRPAASTLSVASLGGIAMSLGRRAAGWLHRGRSHAAAIEATVSVQARGPIGRWTFSAVSHGLWLAFNIGALALLVTLLTVRQYTFSWETTILTSDSYVSLTRGLGWMPRVMGVNTPDEEQIRATRGPGLTEAMSDASEAWSGFLVGCMVMYGFGPRLLLLGLSLGERRAAGRRFRLDTTRPEYLRLAAILMPATESLGVVGEPAGDVGSASADGGKRATRGREARPNGPPAILGLELPQMPDGWPPRFPSTLTEAARWQDLGLADGRDDRVRILRHLAESPTEPEALIVVCALTTTPDRGVGAFLSDLAASLGRSPIVLLTAGESLRRRGDGDELTQRVADWRIAAAEAGIDPERIIELDLDHVTDVSSARLATLLGEGDESLPPARRIEAAFDLIVRHLERWSSSESTGAGPSAVKQAELHREVTALYRGEESAWRNLLHGSAEAAGEFAQRLKSGEVGEQLKAGGARVVSLLPPRLKSSARWLAAGATAGALGCVAAAALLSPVAIGSLPIWAGLGAAIAGAASIGRGDAKSADGSEPTPAPACGFADAVRAATLLALLLETQGRGEAAISRILDASIPEESAEGAEDPDTSQSARAWLDEVRHRFDLALAREAAP
ncbi:MAG: DUF2868 domain-containing protein [Phycisphaerales bacterium]|nr:MAG: DUF2868 domain-containing protein [Phycisphaerales bacterium]